MAASIAQNGEAMVDQPKRIIQVRPTARPARLKRRHILALAGGVLGVVLPLSLLAAYLWVLATPQYQIVAGFTVRQEESGNLQSTALGGLVQLGGLTAQRGDADILYEFIRSGDLVRTLDQNLGLVAHYSAAHARDPLFGLNPKAGRTDVLRYWRRMTGLSYDRASGLIEFRLRAFSPQMALALANAVIFESERLMNDLNLAARENLLEFARHDLARAEADLTAARGAITDFRIRSQMLDVGSDLQGRMGVLNTLQQQLAEALIATDMLAATSGENDPRLAQSRARIDVIEDRIRQERASFANGASTQANQPDYPNLLAQFEALATEQELAETRYAAAVAALELAQDNLARQTRYLAVFIRPALPDSADHPKRGLILGLSALFLSLLYIILTLAAYALRDRR
ncbi:sugar transporter [Rhodobacteraceae bacterium XHP0102]|nr:sugar transporter [Rhodobacteraceae bacterium XHP0102]